jgi:anti-sigma regulatory factor (Ser/Thr protein kinase)
VCLTILEHGTHHSAHPAERFKSNGQERTAVPPETTTSNKEPQPVTSRARTEGATLHPQAPGTALQAQASGTALGGAVHEPHQPTAQFASSTQGAHLARRFAVGCMAEWGHPAPSDASCTVALVVAELAANAVLHGRVPGHTFSLRLSHDPEANLIRIEVADAATTLRPPTTPPSSRQDGAESGRGLLLVDALTVRWGSTPRQPLGKTVWAEVPAGEVTVPVRS